MQVKRLQRRLDEVSSQLLTAREGRATATLEIALLGDRKDDLAEALQMAAAKAADDARVLAEERSARRRAEATVQSSAEQRKRAEAEAAAAEAGAAAEAAERDEWRQRCEATQAALEAALLRQRRMGEEDKRREDEQVSLFTTVAELLARVQSLGAVQPEDLGIGATEMHAHRDDALKHLRGRQDRLRRPMRYGSS